MLNLTDTDDQYRPLLDKKSDHREVKFVNGDDSCWTTLRKSKALVIIIVTGIMMIDVSMITALEPILPEMLDDIYRPGNASTAARHATNQTLLKQIYESYSVQVGVLLGLKPGVEVIGNIIVGPLVDRWGHKVPLLVGSMANIAAMVGFAFAPSFAWLLVARVVQAVGSSLSVVAGLALIPAVFVDDAARSKATSIVFGGLAVGLVLGFPFGSLVYSFVGHAAPFLIMSGLNLFDVMLRLVIIVPTVTGKDKSVHSTEIFKLVKNRFVVVPLLFNIFVHISLGTMLATLPTFMLDTLYAEQWEMAVVMLCSTFFQFLVTYVVSDLIPSYTKWIAIMCGGLLYALGISGYLYAIPGIWYCLIPEIVGRIGLGLYTCSCVPFLFYLSDRFHNGQYGAVNGLYTATINIGMFAGSSAAGKFKGLMGFHSLVLAIVIFLGVTALSGFFVCDLSAASSTKEDSVTEHTKEQSIRSITFTSSVVASH